jgi:DNA-binding MarR family transcriptional regulator
MNIFLAWASTSVLLVVSSVLAFLGKPTEMGVAVLAGAIGLAFASIDKIKKFKGAGFEAEMKEKLQKFQAVIDKETEPEAEVTQARDLKLIDGGKRDVIAALGNPKYTWRFLGGLAKETQLSRETVRAALSELEERQLVQRSSSKEGAMWSLTPPGRETLAALRNDG